MSGPPRSVVVIGACQGCGACLLTCPEKALRAAPGAPIVLSHLCTGCGECAEVCPVDAITVQSPPPPGHGSPAAGAVGAP